MYTMKLILTVAQIFLIVPTMSAQVFSGNISGYILDSATGEALENVNVYISNTTFGAATDREGFFIIESVPAGTHEIVVSIVGYDYITELVYIRENEHIKRNFKLNPRIYETSATEVIGDVPYEWLNNLEIFKKYFIGQSDFTDDCIIENEEVLDFYWQAGGILKAQASAPLQITNKALGYDIRCILADFTFNNIHEKWGWSVKPVFYEIETEDPDEAEEWSENRRAAYTGSTHHFFLSLITQRLSSYSYAAYFVDTPGQRSARHELVYYLEPYEELFTYGENDTYILHFKECLCVVHDLTQISWIKLNLDQVIVDKYGYMQTPNSFRVYGYWASRGLADSLPFYFQPD